eukprot:gene12954-17473_t
MVHGQREKLVDLRQTDDLYIIAINMDEQHHSREELSGVLMQNAVMLQSCGVAGGDDPGVEYAPDMYVSKGYEPMSQLESKQYQLLTVSGKTVMLTKDGKTMREPVKGSIPRDLDFEAGHVLINNFLWMQYPYANSIGGKDL